MDAKVVSMRDAIARYVHDGDTVVIEGFTHLICFAAGHEIIRQQRRNLTLCRLTARVSPGSGREGTAAGAGGILPLRDGGATERGRGSSPVLDAPELHGDRSASGKPADPKCDLSLLRRDFGH